MKTDMVGCGFGHLTEVQPMECEVCGREVCECPHPLGECAECSGLVFDGDPWMVDSEGSQWCMRCWPGGEA
jgi:hypothetical protein